MVRRSGPEVPAGTAHDRVASLVIIAQALRHAACPGMPPDAISPSRHLSDHQGRESPLCVRAQRPTPNPFSRNELFSHGRPRVDRGMYPRSCRRYALLCVYDSAAPDKHTNAPLQTGKSVINAAVRLLPPRDQNSYSELTRRMRRGTDVLGCPSTVGRDTTPKCLRIIVSGPFGNSNSKLRTRTDKTACNASIEVRG
jgi:hypothetical protein